MKGIFEHAPELATIAGDSPTQTAALWRFLLAILYSTLEMRSARDWEQIRAAGHFRCALISAYLDKWRSRFDLCDPERPFYQTPGLERFYVPIQKLFPERAAGNNDTLFDHTHSGSGLTVDGGTAARALVAAQAFSVGGLVSFEQAKDRSAQAAPVAAALVLLISGSTVFETLLRNLTRYDPDSDDPEPFRARNGDLPAWERTESPTPRDRIPDGLRDLLTFQSRRLLLGSTQTDDERLAFDRVAILKGEQLSNGWANRDRDPYVAFRRNEKSQSPRDKWLPIRLSPERAVWRDSGALFSPKANVATKNETVTERPYHFEWLSELERSGYLQSSFFDVMAFGQATDQANVLLWREERLKLPAVFLINRAYCDDLRTGLALCEAAGGFLRRAIQTTLNRLGMNIARDTPHLERAETKFWAQLERDFQEFIFGLASLPVPQDGHFAGQEAPVIHKWEQAVRTVAEGSFRSFEDGLSSNARVLAEVSKARGSLYVALRRQQRKYLQLEAKTA